MTEQISHMAHELSKDDNFEKLKEMIKRILLSVGIIDRQLKPGEDKKHFMHFGQNTNDCAFGCILKPEENILRKKIEIVVKADHTGCRRLRVIIQLGDKLIVKKTEHKERKKWPDPEVFNKEIKYIERDIKIALKKAVKSNS